jgi:hypothetical protein
VPLGGRSFDRPVRGCRSTGDWQAGVMITCVVHYVIDPTESEAFERFARRWMELVNRHGGTHHGYFLPGEGASDAALALFSFPSLTSYERYRARFDVDPDFVAADRIRDESGCVVRYDRTFMRPLLPDD